MPDTTSCDAQYASKLGYACVCRLAHLQRHTCTCACCITPANVLSCSWTLNGCVLTGVCCCGLQLDNTPTLGPIVYDSMSPDGECTGSK
jgi:hypothetical protein